MKNKRIRRVTRVDTNTAEMLAKSNCKQCYGRGTKITQTGINANGSVTIRNDGTILEVISYCSCSERNKEKYKI